MESKKTKYGLIMATYLLGIFMGAIDTGIVTPARTIIQNNLMVDDKTGIWMITIYTLAYAASIPIMGKLADKFGRKYIYLISIFLFGLGSLFCGLSQSFESFSLLLIARTVQAIGGGGIVPVATAEFGTTFPQEKRGMALRLVGGVYGIANIFGSSAGSAILDLFGTNNWQFIFYVNVPITIFILIAGYICLPNTKEVNIKKIDFTGIIVLTVMVLSLLYGLKNIDFFDFKTTLLSTTVYPYLLIFLILVPVFIWAEKRAQDPVLNLSYFKNTRIIITLILAFFTGVVIMGMIFVPQFSENAIKMASGSGGYFVIILGVFAGIGAPISGKLIDKFGVKIVLGFGFMISVIGSVFLILVTANYPSLLTVSVGLILIGTGIGFTMGTPLNYMMLDNTKREESNSALAAVSLVRSIGTAIAPAIMVGFISHAGMAVQSNIMDILPTQVHVDQLPYAQELNDKLNEFKADEKTKDMLANVDIPDLESMQVVNINMSSDNGNELPQELIDLLKSSDVTTITENSKIVSTNMFQLMAPERITTIENGIDNGIQGIQSGIEELNLSILDLQNAYSGIGKGISGMESAILSQDNALQQLKSMTSMLSSLPPGVVNPNDLNLISMIPPNVMSQVPQEVVSQISDIKTMEDLNIKISELEIAEQTLSDKVQENKNSQQEMLTAIESMKDAQAEMNDMITKMTILKDSVPDAFASAKDNYLEQIEDNRNNIEKVFQATLNTGFKQIYLTVAIVSLLGLIILMFYKKQIKRGDTQ